MWTVNKVDGGYQLSLDQDGMTDSRNQPVFKTRAQAEAELEKVNYLAENYRFLRDNPDVMVD